MVRLPCACAVSGVDWQSFFKVWVVRGEQGVEASQSPLFISRMAMFTDSAIASDAGQGFS